VKVNIIVGFVAGGMLAVVAFVAGVNAMQTDATPASQQSDLYRYADQ